MATLNASIAIRVRSDLQNTLALQAAAAPMDMLINALLANGGGDGQATGVWADERTLAGAANENLDFTGGGFVDAHGVVIAFTKVKTILIVADGANTTDLTITPKSGGALPFITGTTPAVAPLPKNGIFLLHIPSAAGIAVTAGTGDSINIANAAGASAKYRVVIFGA